MTALRRWLAAQPAERTELAVAGAAVAFAAGGIALSAATPRGWLRALPIALYLLTWLCGGGYLARGAASALAQRRPCTQMLVLLAAAGSVAAARLGEGALLLAMFSLGYALGALTLGRARRTVDALAALIPPTAVVRRGVRLAEVPIGDVATGEVVVVQAGARVPVDGVVVAGHSTVNESAVTGASLPVRKSTAPAQQRVFAGTLNGDGVLAVRAARPAAQSSLARVVGLVRGAEIHGCTRSRLARRVELICVPMAGALAAGLLAICLLALREPAAVGIERMVALLVAASPCALGIAVPGAVLCALAHASRGGVIIKGGGPLERLGALSAIAFCQARTLATARPRLTDVICADGVTEAELLSIAVGVADAVTARWEHPLAEAVAWDGRDRLAAGPARNSGQHSGQHSERPSGQHSEQHSSGYPDPSGGGNGAGTPRFPQARTPSMLPGQGVSAFVRDDEVLAGKLELFYDSSGPPPPDRIRATVRMLEARGRSAIVIRRAGRYLGMLGLTDTPCPVASAATRRLRAMGIRTMVLLSARNQQVADIMAAQAGADGAHGGLLPAGKAAIVSRLRDAGHQVAMVRDGLRDAIRDGPRASDDVITVGAAANHAAFDGAGVALMSPDLSGLSAAVHLGRAARRVIRQNLLVGLGAVALLVPAALAGLPLGVTAAAQQVCAIIVAANSLRLLRFGALKGSGALRVFRVFQAFWAEPSLLLCEDPGRGHLRQLGSHREGRRAELDHRIMVTAERDMDKRVVVDGRLVRLQCRMTVDRRRARAQQLVDGLRALPVDDRGDAHVQLAVAAAAGRPWLDPLAGDAEPKPVRERRRGCRGTENLRCLAGRQRAAQLCLAQLGKPDQLGRGQRATQPRAQRGARWRRERDGRVGGQCESRFAAAAATGEAQGTSQNSCRDHAEDRAGHSDVRSHDLLLVCRSQSGPAGLTTAGGYLPRAGTRRGHDPRANSTGHLCASRQYRAT
jgi:Cd2+/Zn2+-exporting ATPase